MQSSAQSPSRELRRLTTLDAFCTPHINGTLPSIFMRRLVIIFVVLCNSYSVSNCQMGETQYSVRLNEYIVNNVNFIHGINSRKSLGLAFKLENLKGDIEYLEISERKYSKSISGLKRESFNAEVYYFDKNKCIQKTGKSNKVIPENYIEYEDYFHDKILRGSNSFSKLSYSNLFENKIDSTYSNDTLILEFKNKIEKYFNDNLVYRFNKEFQYYSKFEYVGQRLRRYEKGSQGRYLYVVEFNDKNQIVLDSQKHIEDNRTSRYELSYENNALTNLTHILDKGDVEYTTTIEFVYNDQMQCVSNILEVKGFRDKVIAEYEYNENGDLIFESKNITYKYQYDHVGNWIRREKYFKALLIEEANRVIKYYK